MSRRASRRRGSGLPRHPHRPALTRVPRHPGRAASSPRAGQRSPGRRDTRAGQRSLGRKLRVGALRLGPPCNSPVLRVADFPLMDGSRPRRGAHERRVAAANWFSSRRPAHRGQPDSPGGHRDVRGLSITRKGARPRPRSCVGAGQTDATVWAAWVASAVCVIFDMRRASSPQLSGPLRRRCMVRIARLSRLSRRVDQEDRPPSCSPPISTVVSQPSCSPPISTVVPLEGEKDPRSNGAPDQLVERRAVDTVSWCKNPGYGRVPAVGGGPALTPTAVSPIPPHPADLGSPLRRRWAPKSVHNSRRCTVPP